MLKGETPGSAGMARLDRASGRWWERDLRLPLTVLAGGLLSLVTVSALGGLLWAMAGRFRPLAVLVTVAVLFPIALRVLLPVLRTPRGGDPLRWPLILALAVVVLAQTVVNVRSSSEHLLTNRDPGVYVTTAAWLAREGHLLVDGVPSEAWLEEPHLVLASQGYYDIRTDGRLYPQFLHSLPVLMALAWWAGGPGFALTLNALLGGLALLLFFLLAERFMRAWLALAATLTLGVNLVQIHFSQDAFTEILTQVFLFGGFWLLVGVWRDPSPGRGVLAGVILGATCATRIDAFVYLVPLVLYLGYEAVRSRATGASHRWGSFVLPLAAGLALPALVGAADLALYSPQYLRDLWRNVRLIALALGAAGLGAAGLVTLQALVPRTWRVIERLRSPLSLLGAAAVVVGTVYAYFLRPHLETGIGPPIGLIGGLQTRAVLPVDPRRSYAELTMHWLAWYLGLGALALGVAGWAEALRRSLRGAREELLPWVLVFSSLTVVYLWKPSITPDQIWAMRRFLPVTIPGLVLLACWWLDQRWNRLSGRGARWLVAALAVGLLVVPPLRVSLPVVAVETQRGLLQTTRRLCEELGPDTVVAVTDPRLQAVYAPAVRALCRVPTVGLAPGDPAALDSLHRLAGEEGRTLLVLDDPDRMVCRPPTDVLLDATVQYELRRREILGPPRRHERASFSYILYRPDAPALPEGPAERRLSITGLAFENGAFVEMPRDPLAGGPSAFTVELFMATTWTPPRDSSLLLAGGTYPGGWWFEYRPDGRLDFFARFRQGLRSVSIPPGNLNDGNLHHVVATLEDGRLAISCNGRQAASAASPLLLEAGDRPLFVAKASGEGPGSVPFQGFLDDLRIWGGVLPAPEKGSEEIPLLGEWSFEPNPDGLALDGSGRGNHGRVVGATWVEMPGP